MARKELREIVGCLRKVKFWMLLTRDERKKSIIYSYYLITGNPSQDMPQKA